MEEYRNERGNGNLYCKNCNSLWDIKLVNTDKNSLEEIKVINIPPKEKNPFANKTVKLKKSKT